jgi:hypothetical protein
MSGRGAEEEPTVEIRFTTHARGRGLFATRAFRPGECILRERALLAAQFAANRAVVGAACAHCLRTFEMAETSLVRYLSDPARAQAAGALPLPGRDKYGAPQLDAPVRCEQCRDEIYCSVDCRDEAASHYHRYLCVAQDHSGALRELRALCAAKDDSPRTPSSIRSGQCSSLECSPWNALSPRRSPPPTIPPFSAITADRAPPRRVS